MNSLSKKIPHLAVYLPEIVGHILSFLIPVCNDDPKRKLFVDIFSCLFVNRMWSDCAIRAIWRRVTFDDSREDFEAFLKFTTVLHRTPSQTQVCNTSPPTLQIAYNDRTIITDEVSMTRYPSRSSSISSVSTFDSINTPTECSSMDFMSAEEMETKDIEMDKACVDSNDKYFDDSAWARSKIYRNALRCLTIRKRKEKSINEPLSKIAESATNLKYLDIYICDHFVNETLYLFIQHRTITYLSLAGCHNISDEAILKVAEYCRGLEHLDLRACGSVSDVSLSEIAMNCPKLKHLNVGRIRDREKVTSKSIILFAKHTQATVLGLAGCDVDDTCMKALATYRQSGLERVSVNSCSKISNKTVYAFIKHCPNLSVFEMKECHHINDWEAVAELVQRNVLLTLCDHQNRACADWARIRGRTLDVKAPLK